MELFATATREQFRFSTVKGLISVEDLWQLPLSSKTSFDLDTVAKNVNTELKQLTEESFVSVTPAPGRKNAELRLEVVKAVIAVKMEEAEKTRLAKSRAEEKQRLLTLLDEKHHDELKGLTKSELQARIDALG
jgi:hypothetical protein